MDMKACSKTVKFYKWTDTNKFKDVAFNIENSKMHIRLIMSHASSTIEDQVMHIVIQNIHLRTPKENGITNSKAKRKPAPPKKNTKTTYMYM